MSSFWQKAMAFLGLVEEDEVEGDGVVDAPARPARPVATSAAHQAAVRTVRPTSGRPGTPVAAPPSAPRTATPGRTVGRRVEPPPATARTMAADRTLAHDRAESGAAEGAVRPVAAADVRAEVLTVETFEEAKRLADRIRERIPVVLDLRETDPTMVRRLVDFASGLTYALDGSMTKIGQGVILVLPPRIALGREEKRRLARLGLYQLDDIGA